MRRHRNAKIIATLGPASSSRDIIRELFLAGADVFRLNFSHGSSEQHRARLEAIRSLENETGRPIGVLLDLQGPKLRVGRLEGGRAALAEDAHFRLDLDAAPGDRRRAPRPHPAVFAALEPGIHLLLDDGKIRLRVTRCGPDFA
ncbi:MAG: pyruvate kinase, partial [Gammaproteobacteria bacterium]|nr:pyruvate kinase [Gammaproteobacteria bacterium]